MIDHIVVDVEIKTPIEQLPGKWNDTDKMGVACAVVYEYKTDRFRIYGPSDEELLELRSRLNAADKISGFNIWGFDFPVIFGLPGRQRVEHLRSKTNDILRRVWVACGCDPDSHGPKHAGFKLDDIMKATFGIGKIGDGASAPLWFQAGQLSRVINYCVDDVHLERDLVDFVDRHGFVIGRDREPVYLDKDKWQP